MKKTNNASKYLQKAQKLLEKAAGETEETINETLEWLKHNKYKNLSVNPFILYLNGEETKVFVDEIKKITKMKVDIDKLYENGYL